MIRSLWSFMSFHPSFPHSGLNQKPRWFLSGIYLSPPRAGLHLRKIMAEESGKSSFLSSWNYLLPCTLPAYSLPASPCTRCHALYPGSWWQCQCSWLQGCPEEWNRFSVLFSWRSWGAFLSMFLLITTSNEGVILWCVVVHSLKSCLTLQPHGLQHTRLPCRLPFPRVCSN